MSPCLQHPSWISLLFDTSKMKLRLSAITVEPVLFLCMQVFFLHLVALPQIILENVCLQNHNKTRCDAMYKGSFKKDYDEVQAQASLWMAALLVAAASITALTLPFVATLSDELGRRKILLLTPICQLVQGIILVCILARGLLFPTWILVIVGMIPGVVGDITGTYVLTYAYIADITTEKSRTLRINLLEACSILSGLTSTFSSGYIIESYGYKGIYVACIAVVTAAILYLIFVLKPVEKPVEPVDKETSIVANANESLDNPSQIDLDCSKEKFSCKSMDAVQDDGGIEVAVQEEENDEKSTDRAMPGNCEGAEPCQSKEAQPTAPEAQRDEQSKNGVEGRKPLKATVIYALKASNPIGNLLRVGRALKSNGSLAHGVLLFVLMMLAAISYSAELAVMVLYLKTAPFYLSSIQIGTFLAFQSASLAILGLIGFNILLTRVFKVDDHTILLITASFYVIYCVLLGTANSLVFLYMTQLVHALSTINVSTIRAMISKVTPPSTVGLLFSAMLIVETISVLIGSMVGPLVYSAVVSTHPGFVFFLNALFMFASTCVSFYLFLTKRNKHSRGSFEVEASA